MASKKGYVWNGSEWVAIGSDIVDTTALETTLPLPPIGSVNQFAGSTAPTRWLLCYGQAISRTYYQKLYEVVGTTYGTGDGSTTFNLPDLRGRVAAGPDNMGGSDAARLDWANTLGTTGGTQTHTLTSNEMPSHTHTQNAHSHATFGATWGGSDASYVVPWNTASGGTRWSGDTTATNQNTGGGAAHNNMQPTILLNYIIRAL